mmetsp:Transcript_2821/g.4408  ORF Transcript_2821/g.4408 Transcript_2821/m.4408 type:complete len:163 (+) Transcript_2821:41-529(+)
MRLLIFGGTHAALGAAFDKWLECNCHVCQYFDKDWLHIEGRPGSEPMCQFKRAGLHGRAVWNEISLDKFRDTFCPVKPALCSCQVTIAGDRVSIPRLSNMNCTQCSTSCPPAEYFGDDTADPGCATTAQPVCSCIFPNKEERLMVCPEDQGYPGPVEGRADL